MMGAAALVAGSSVSRTRVAEPKPSGREARSIGDVRKPADTKGGEQRALRRPEHNPESLFCLYFPSDSCHRLGLNLWQEPIMGNDRRGQWLRSRLARILMNSRGRTLGRPEPPLRGQSTSFGRWSSTSAVLQFAGDLAIAGLTPSAYTARETDCLRVTFEEN
jgi:hypothetical protein